MAQSIFEKFGVDTSTIEIQDDFELMPIGKYPIIVTDAEMSESRAGAPMLKMTLEVTGEKFAGRKLWVQQVINNQVGMKVVAGFCNALLGYNTPEKLNQFTSADQFLGKEAVAKVGIRKSDEYGDKNEVKGLYKPQAKAAVQIAGADTTAANSTAPIAAKTDAPF